MTKSGLWKVSGGGCTGQSRKRQGISLAHRCIDPAPRRAGKAVPDRVQQGCCTRAYTDVFTARPGMSSPLEALRQSANCKKLDLRLRGGDVGRAEMTGRGGRAAGRRGAAGERREGRR